MSVVTGIQRLASSEIGTDPSKAPDPGIPIVPIPKRRYTSRAFMALEWERLWTKIWHVAGRERTIPGANDYFTYELGKESFIIVRGEDNRIRAFHNVCLHRGNRLRHGIHAGNTPSFKCMYHHWEWNTDGTVKNIPDYETFDNIPPCEKLKMREVRCDVWGGFVFICMDKDAPGLYDFLGVIPKHLDCYGFDRMVCINNVTIPWDCNWKTSVDAFNETYHVQGIHPQIMPWHDDVNVQIDCYERHSRFLAPFMAPSPRLGEQQMNELGDVMRATLEMLQFDPAEFEGRATEVRLAMQKKKRALQDHVPYPYKDLNDDQLTDDYHYTIFPNMQLNVFAESLMVFVSRPHATDPNKMYWDLMHFRHKQSPDEEIADMPWQLTDQDSYATPNPGTKEVLDQDAYNLPHVQDGMNSDAFQEIIIGRQELRIAHFHKTLMDYVKEDRFD